MLRTITHLLALLAFAFTFAGPAFAQTAPASEADRQKELEQALEAAFKAAKTGPAEVRLGAQGKIDLPAGYRYVPVTEAQRLMRAFGNRTGPTFLGLILSAGDDGWLTVINYNSVGYVKDDDAKNWKSDELLQQLKDGTEEGNAERLERGFRPIEVAGWVEPPAYDTGAKRLVWSALVRDKGLAPGAVASVNYNTYALGREGFYQLNLVTGSDRIEGEKKHAKVLLAALSYDLGKRYEDFNPTTDRVAEYGLAALIAGAAAKKLGLLAAIGVFFLKFWKIAAVAVFGLGALLTKLFKSKG